MRSNGEPAIGVVDTGRGRILDLAQAAEYAGHADAAFHTMLALIEGGEPVLRKARAAAQAWSDKAEHPLQGTQLLSPLPIPQQIRDCLVFEQHLVNAMKTWEKITGKPAGPISPTWYQRPSWYKGNRLRDVATVF